MLLILIAFRTLSLALAGGDGAAWTYTGPHGQNHWSPSYPACAGKAQSPVNIETRRVVYNSSLPPIKTKGYREPEDPTFLLLNEGHTVKMCLPPSMYLDGLPKRYTAQQLHLHWGSGDIQGGAEHRVNGMAFPAELHVVHYNSEDYSSAKEARDQPDGLAVLGVLIEVAEEPNPAYDHILNYLKNIKYAGQEISIPSFDVQYLLPDQLDQYYRYRGSLTTPPCYESVLWTVFYQKVQISTAQLSKLQHTLYSSRAEKSPVTLENNFRRLQPLNNRTVYSTFPLGPPFTYSTGEIAAIVVGTVLALVGLVLGLYFLVKRSRTQKQQGQKVVVFKSSASCSETADPVLQQP
ncbi:carbonic anhydrase 14 isoform X3 [Rhinatrema bivittatum]|uniref:carbonic anhydrase 14 isoform X3 n=1 Tax=Rhinatrema bivittatum TaxID=194408 RepID=UPI001127CD35|nr:carbonic anhydrase 14 isoform X3 [Rhinatrema bivittatum]